MNKIDNKGGLVGVVGLALTLSTTALAQQGRRPAAVVPWSDGPAPLNAGNDAHGGGGGLAGGTSGPQGAGDHIVSLQCTGTTGGWNWPHGGCTATYNNITAPICEGLLTAYAATGDIDFRNAAVTGGNYDLTFQYPNTERRFSAFTAAFFRHLSQETGNAAYSSAAETDFFDALATATYSPSDLNTAGWIAALQASRSGSLINLRPWDLHQLPWVAGQIGNPGQQNAFRDAVLDGLATLDTAQPYDVLGLAGGIRGLALNGTTSFPAIASPAFPLINTHTSLAQLANALISLQQGNGSWLWTTGGAPIVDEDTQTTAYAVLALVAAEAAGAGSYSTQIALGRAYLASMQEADGGYLTYPFAPPIYANNIEVDAEAVWARGVGTAVTLNAPTCNNTNTLTVTIDKSVTTMGVVGGQFFLSYNTTYLSNPVVSAGDAPFTELIAADTSVAGEIFVATGVDFENSTLGVTAPAVMARVTFTVASQTCGTANLVTWRTPAPPSPPTRLTDADANSILPALSNLGTIRMDYTAPSITCPPNATLEYDPSDPYGLPGSLLGTAVGGVEIEYNAGQPEVPAQQAYLKAQLSHTNSNGMHLTFSNALLPPYNFPGISWATIFGQTSPSQFGFDMVLPAPTWDTLTPIPLLNAYDNFNNNCPTPLVTPNFIWALNNYYGIGGPTVTSCIINSLFRSDGLGLGPVPPAPAVTVTKNVLSRCGNVWTVRIGGYLQSDNLIHWYNPATPDSPVSNFLLNGRIYFDGTLTYDSTGDPGNDGDFYAGTITLSFNSPYPSAGVPSVSDNCDPQPVVTFTDAVVNGDCAQEKFITRTWTATDSCGNFSTCVQQIHIDDTTPPVFAECCPMPTITVNSQAGSCSASAATVNPQIPTASDSASAVTLTYERSDGALLTLADPFPQGTTTITWTATDACGNFSECEQDIVVTGMNEVVATVQLQPNIDPPGTLTRCITFDFWTTGGTIGYSTSVEVEFDVLDTGPMTPNTAIGTAMFEIPCTNGPFVCCTARDALHTLRRTDEAFHVAGTQYIADFTGSIGSGGDWLLGGNLDDNEYIDILDFGWFINQYGQTYGLPVTGDTDCLTLMPHADVSGDGSVDIADYTFIQINFLKFHENNCWGSLNRVAGGGSNPDRRYNEGPITRIANKELIRRGLKPLTRADLNNDGWVDTLDIQVFSSNGGPN